MQTQQREPAASPPSAMLSPLFPHGPRLCLEKHSGLGTTVHLWGRISWSRTGLELITQLWTPGPPASTFQTHRMRGDGQWPASPAWNHSFHTPGFQGGQRRMCQPVTLQMHTNRPLHRAPLPWGTHTHTECTVLPRFTLAQMCVSSSCQDVQ